MWRWITFASHAAATPQISVATEGGSGTAVPDLSIEVDNVDEVQDGRIRDEGFWRSPERTWRQLRVNRSLVRKRSFLRGSHGHHAHDNGQCPLHGCRCRGSCRLVHKTPWLHRTVKRYQRDQSAKFVIRLLRLLRLNVLAYNPVEIAEFGRTVSEVRLAAAKAQVQLQALQRAKDAVR